MAQNLCHIHKYICLLICLLVCLFIYLFTCLFTWLFTCLFVYLFVYCLLVCLHGCLLVCLFTCLFTVYLSVYMVVYLFVYLFVYCLHGCLLVCLFVCLFRMVDLSSLQHKDSLTRQSNLGEFLSSLHKNTVPIAELTSEDKYDLVSVLVENVKNSNPRLILPSLECLQALSDTCLTTELNLLNKTIIGILYSHFHTFSL